MAMNQQMPDITQVLLAACSQNSAEREPAEKILAQLEAQQLDKFLAMLAMEMANQNKPENVRQMAGLLLQNTVSSKDARSQEARNRRWLAMPADSRQKIRDTVLGLLATPSKVARNTAAVVIAKIAAVEIPAGHWGNLVQILVENTKKAADENIRESLFKCLSYVAEEVPQENLVQFAGAMLDAMSEGMKSENPAVRYAATNCLGSSLEIIKENIYKQEHRKLILQMVYQGAIYGVQDSNPQSAHPAEKVRMASFSVLIQVAWHYYELLETEIEDIFRLTVQAIQKDTEDVKLRAIEFWSTVAETEADIVLELQDAHEAGRPAERQLKNFVNKAAQHLTPALLQCLTVREEGAGEEWNQSSAAGTCIGLIAEAIRDGIVPFVLPFVEENIQKQEWNLREASILAFGYILNGPSKEKMRPLVEQALPRILSFVRDKNDEVKDTAAWTVGRICDLVPQAVGKESLKGLMQTAAEALKAEPRVAAKMCWAIHNLADAVPKEQSTSPLSEYFEFIAAALLNAAAREDADDANLLPSAYEALNLLIQTSGDDVQNVVEKLVPTIVDRLQKSVQKLISDRDLAKEMDLRALLVGSLASIVQRLSREKILGQARQLLEIFLHMLQTQNIVLHEEVLMAVGAMAQKLEKDFHPYFGPFKPFVINALSVYQSHEIVQVAVGVIGDVCRALESRIEEHCDDLVRVLLASLQKQELDRTVKPHIINCLGDIALAIGRSFERYLSYVMVMFIQASHVTFEKPDHNESEYLGNLRESILEAYTLIVQGLDAGGAVAKFDDYVNSVIELIGLLMNEGCKDAGVLAAACGCVGDIVSCMGPKIVPRFQNEKVQQLIRVSREIKVDKVQNNVQWAMEALQGS